MKKQYTQFSKKIVVAVTTAVTAIVLVGVILAYMAGQFDQATAIIRVYIQYSMVVFAAYSGNSAFEKWVISKQSSSDTTTSDNG